MIGYLFGKLATQLATWAGSAQSALGYQAVTTENCLLAHERIQSLRM